MIKKIGILILSLMIVFLLTACSQPTTNTPQIPTLQPTTNTSQIPTKTQPQVGEVKTTVAYSNMNLFRQDGKRGYYVEQIVDNYGDWQEISALIPSFKADYDEKFFDENALIVFVLERGYSGAQLENVTVTNTDEEVIVKIDANNGILCAITEWAVVLEASKSDLFLDKTLRLDADFSWGKDLDAKIPLEERYDSVLEQMRNNND